MIGIGGSKLVETHIWDLHLCSHTRIEETKDWSRHWTASGSVIDSRSCGVNWTRNMNTSFIGCVRISFWFRQRLGLVITFKPREECAFP